MEALPSLKTKPSRLSWLIKEKGQSSQNLVPRLDQDSQPPTTTRLPKDLRSPKSTVKWPLNQPNEPEAQPLGSNQVAPSLDGVLSKQKQPQLPKTKPELLLSSVSEDNKLPPRAPRMNQEGPPPDTKSLKQQLHLCLTHFKELIATALESLKISVHAKPHFSAIVTWLGDLLSRLETWTHDSGINDPTIAGKELDARLNSRITALFRNIMTRLERVRKDVEVMRIAAEQMSGSGMTDRERVCRLQKAAHEIESENKAISIIVHDFVDLTDAIWTEQGPVSRRAPLPGVLEEELRSAGDSSPAMSRYPVHDGYTGFDELGVPKPSGQSRPRVRQSIGQRMRLWGREK